MSVLGQDGKGLKQYFPPFPFLESLALLTKLPHPFRLLSLRENDSQLQQPP